MKRPANIVLLELTQRQFHAINVTITYKSYFEVCCPALSCPVLRRVGNARILDLRHTGPAACRCQVSFMQVHAQHSLQLSHHTRINSFMYSSSVWEEKNRDST